MFLYLKLFLEIEFNVTGNYGSPVHTNHNANYSSMPSPDMDQMDRKQNDQSRRPLSVATDNMMLEFYKKDGYEPSVSTESGVWRRCVTMVEYCSSLATKGWADMFDSYYRTTETKAQGQKESIKE